MRAVISLGSNSGNRDAHIQAAIDAIDDICCVVRRSRLYETPAIDGVSAPYVNAVIEIDTELEAMELDRGLKSLETSLGRDRSRENGNNVVIDLDLVMADGLVLRPKDARQTYFKIGYEQIL